MKKKLRKQISDDSPTNSNNVENDKKQAEDSHDLSDEETDSQKSQKGNDKTKELEEELMYKLYFTKEEIEETNHAQRKDMFIDLIKQKQRAKLDMKKTGEVQKIIIEDYAPTVLSKEAVIKNNLASKMTQRVLNEYNT